MEEKTTTTTIAKNSNQPRVKNMMYAQQLAHLPTKSVDKLEELIKNKLKPKKYALIVHDKDVNDKGQPEADHVHAMLCFDNARSVNNVARQLGDRPQYMEAWNGKAENGFAYLIHATDNARTRHQYDVSEVKANFDYPEMIKKIDAEVRRVDKLGDTAKIKTLLNLILAGAITRDEAEKQLTGAQYAKAKRQLADVEAKRMEECAKEWRHEMKESGKPIEVLWLYGLPGTGKTSFAKALAEKRKESYYIAGSSRDIFQNYKGQHILILDELRPQSIPYRDLLNILNPFGMGDDVMSPSRYQDKALTCDLIIITSPYNPFVFYSNIFGGQGQYKEDPIDRFEQLRRRISLTVLMTDSEICKADYNEQVIDRYVQDLSSVKPNIYSTAARPPMPDNADNIFKSLFD